MLQTTIGYSKFLSFWPVENRNDILAEYFADVLENVGFGFHISRNKRTIRQMGLNLGNIHNIYGRFRLLLHVKAMI